VTIVPVEGSDVSTVTRPWRKRTPRADTLIFGPPAVAVVALAAVAGYALAVPRWPWAGGAAALALVGCVIARVRNGATTVTLWWAICVFLGAGWLGWSRFVHIRLALLWLLLALGAIALAMSYPRVCERHTQRVEEAERRAAEAERLAEQLAIRNHWPRLLERIGHPGIKIVSRQDTASGYVLALRLPSSGRVTITKLRMDLERLEVAADTRRGSLHFEEGETARDVLLYVSKRDFLAETIPYEDNGELLSIHNPIPIGRYEDGTICALTLREIAVLIVGVRGAGKALALDTPVPTPDGWTTMGALKAGDVVYDETGAPCRVTDAWDVRHGRPCYEIEFSDGSKIVADAEHQWLVDTVLSRRSESRARLRVPLDRPRRGGCDQKHKMHQPEVLATAEMIPSLRVRAGTAGTEDGRENNYSVKVAAPLHGTHASLPVGPYTLGAWLGDGWSATGAITTADPEILTEIEAEGETVWIMPSTISGASKPEHLPRSCQLAGSSPCSPTGKPVARGLCVNHLAIERRAGRLDRWPLRHRDTTRRERLAGYRVGGLKVRLRAIGVLDNKHIPDVYLRASEPQRRALLAGLLDTDGGCSKAGAVEFYSSRELLARNVHHLAATLGYKPMLRSKTARLNGKDCGLAWTVTFTTADKVFRLPRKAFRQVTSERATAGRRYISAIRPVPSVPVRCIAVDSPSHLYLVGDSCIPTHNSNLLNVFLAQLSRCVDVLIFCIDMKYRMAMPWVAPYLEDKGHGMAVDWAATDRTEAAKMLRAFVRGIQARAAAGEGEEKIEPEPGRPAVFLVIDEIASIFGMDTGPKPSAGGLTNTALSGLGTDAVRLGRSEAMDIIAASQRGSVSMLGSGDFKSQFPLRIGLSVQNETEALSVIPDDQQAAKILASLKHEGTGLVQWREGRMMRVKFFRITPSQVGEIARRYGPMKPKPEAVLADALGEDYAGRWERFRATRKAAVRAGREARENPTDRQFQEITAQLGDIDDAAHDESSAPRRRMREFIGRSAERGVTVSMIVNLLDSEHLPADENTVRRWLADDIDRSLPSMAATGCAPTACAPTAGNRAWPREATRPRRSAAAPPVSRSAAGQPNWSPDRFGGQPRASKSLSVATYADEG
jgi:hypothetical protein